MEISFRQLEAVSYLHINHHPISDSANNTHKLSSKSTQFFIDDGFLSLKASRIRLSEL